MTQINTSVAVHIVVPDAAGVRLDVQRECVETHPALAAFVVEPAEPVHDCGPNGVRLFAPDFASLEAAAPVSGSPWDVFVEGLTEPSDAPQG